MRAVFEFMRLVRSTVKAGDSVFWSEMAKRSDDNALGVQDGSAAGCNTFKNFVAADVNRRKLNSREFQIARTDVRGYGVIDSH